MNTRDLIDSLVSEARPVRPLPAPSVLALTFVLGSLPVVGLVAWALEWRKDIEPHLVAPWFLIVSGLLVAASLAACIALATLALPGRKGFRTEAIVAGVFVVAMVVLWLSRTPWILVPDFGVWIGRSVQCTSCVTLMALIPGAAGLWLLRRGAPVRPVLAGALLGAAVGVLGTMAVGFVCDWDEPVHVLIAHLLVPVGGLTALGALAGWRWLRW